MRPKRELQRSIEQVGAVYRKLEDRNVSRNCIGRSDCCRFRLTGQTPYITRGESLLAAKAWRATGRKNVPEPADGSCPFLDPATTKCRIYKDRPFPCRTHFCKPAGGPYHRHEVQDLIWELEQIDANLGGTGSRPITDAVREVI